MQDTAGEVRANYWTTITCGFLHTDKLVFNIRFEAIYNSTLHTHKVESTGPAECNGR